MTPHRPLFVQIAEQIEDDILSGVLAEGDQVPSTNEIAARLGINPATVGKGMRLLVEEGHLYKRRGVGMFVSAGAKARVTAERHDRFSHTFVAPLVAEALRLGISAEELAGMVTAEAAAAGEQGP